MNSGPIRAAVNGADRDLGDDPARSLLSALREELGLTGAKYGCGEGACGACTVLVDGAVTRACVTALEAVDGRTVTTVEGLADGDRLHPVQQAFAATHAMQCGYCTPGMVVAAAALLADDTDPSERAIRSWMQPNICRCGTYPRIVRAVQHAAELARAGTPSPMMQSPAPTPTLDAPDAPWDLRSPEENDYFAVLGDGLVVIVPPDPTSGTGGAWLHAGANGAVTAFVGKVEVGQGTRRALQFAVARELGRPVENVRIVMGDTDVCPFDVGTFGSRSMPTVLPDLRIAGAAARVELERAPALAGDRRAVVASREVALLDADDWPELVAVADGSVIDAVTGAKRFATDVVLPGMWHGRVLRPPAPRRRLRRVDVAAARAFPDVVVAHDNDFVGVAAPSLAAAQRALDAIVAEWDDVDLVGDAGLHEYLRTHPPEIEGWDGAFEQVAGDAEATLTGAPVHLAQTYTAEYIAHAPMETRVAVAQWADDRLTVWTATQRPFGSRQGIAEKFGLAETAVRVIVPESGGGFGGKHRPDAAIEAARLARACGHPVQVRWTREEEFTHAYFRPAAVIDVAAGATSDGDLTAWDFTNINSGNAGIMCPYEIPNQRIRFQPAESPLRQGAYRALASTANHFARESMLDELAHELHVDPLDLRLRHLRDQRMAAVLTAAATRFGWTERPTEPGIGAGIAVGTEKNGRVATCVEIRMEPGADELEIVRAVTAFECGAIVDAENLRNQVEGAVVMGIGGALYEAMRFDRDHIVNPRFSEYRVARFGDTPPIDVVLVDRPDLPAAGGGEAPIIAIAPALANAIFAATGERRRTLPLLGGTPSA